MRPPAAALGPAQQAPAAGRRHQARRPQHPGGHARPAGHRGREQSHDTCPRGSQRHGPGSPLTILSCLGVQQPRSPAGRRAWDSPFLSFWLCPGPAFFGCMFRSSSGTQLKPGQRGLGGPSKVSRGWVGVLDSVPPQEKSSCGRVGVHAV